MASSLPPIEEKRVLFLPMSDGPFAISCLRPSGGGKGAAEGVSRRRMTSLLYDQPPAFLSFKIILTFHIWTRTFQPDEISTSSTFIIITPIFKQVEGI